MTVIGTLEHPVHAVNLDRTIEEMEEHYPDAIIVAVDAAVGRWDHVGLVTLEKGRCVRDSACERNLPPLATFPSPGSSAGRRAETHYFYRAYACPRSCGLRTASAAASALDCGSSGDVSKTFPVRLCRFDMFCRSPMLYFGKNSTKRVYVVRVNKEAAGRCLDMPAA